MLKVFQVPFSSFAKVETDTVKSCRAITRGNFNGIVEVPDRDFLPEAVGRESADRGRWSSSSDGGARRFSNRAAGGVRCLTKGNKSTNNAGDRISSQSEQVERADL